MSFFKDLTQELFGRVKCLAMKALESNDEKLFDNTHFITSKLYLLVQPTNDCTMFEAKYGVQEFKPTSRGYRVNADFYALWEAYFDVHSLIELYLDIIDLDIVPAGSHRIDSMTRNAESNKPITREFLQSHYEVCSTFSNVSLNSINDSLPSRLSSKALSKLIKDVFPEAQSRRFQGDVKYSLRELQ